MAEPRQMLFDAFRLDLEDMSLWKDGARVALTPKAFAVLRHLVQHPTTLVTKEDLFAAVWPETVVSDATLTSCVKEIRRVLGDYSHAPRFIETVHKRGFRFLLPIHTAPPSVPPSTFHISSSETQRLALDLQSSPLVGRDAELAQLRTWLATALRGERQLVFITGAPGIGKTTITETFLQSLVVACDARIASGQCIEHYGTGEPYLPVLNALAQLCRLPEGEHIVALLDQYAPTWLLQLPALLRADERERLQRQLAGVTSDRMLREMADLIEALSRERPLVLLLDDLQWSDYATIDLLSFLARRRQPAQLLVLGSYRPVDVIVGNHPLKGLKQELQARGQCKELSLGQLTEEDVSAYLTERFPVCPDTPRLARAIHQRTDGNPLFMVNVVDYVQRHELLVEQDGHWLLRGSETEISTSVPENLRGMIAQQLDRLPQTEQELLEAASVAGMRFSVTELAAALAEDEAVIEDHCEQLARQGRFLRALGFRDWPDGNVAACYEFAHALYQNVLYQRISSVKRSRLHQRVGNCIAHAYGEQASDVAAELSMHFEQGRDYARAILALQQAADTAVHRRANREAMNYLTKALALVHHLPHNPARDQHELALQLALGPVFIAAKGNAAAEVEQVYVRARELCQQLGDTEHLFPVLFGLRSFYLMWGENRFAHTLGLELLQVAQNTSKPDFLLEAHVALASTSFFLGDFPLSLEHVEAGSALYHSSMHAAHASMYGLDPGVFCLCRAGQVLWMLGYAEQARERVLAALSLARALPHLYSLTFALLNVSWVFLFCRQGAEAQQYAEEGLALATEHEFPFFLSWGGILRGLALTLQGKGPEGVVHMRRSLAFPAPAADATRSYLLTLLAEAYLLQGSFPEGLATLDEIVKTEAQSGERFLEAERYRLQGELRLQQARTFPRTPSASQRTVLTHAHSPRREPLAPAKRQRKPKQGQ